MITYEIFGYTYLKNEYDTQCVYEDRIVTVPLDNGLRNAFECFGIFPYVLAERGQLPYFNSELGIKIIDVK